MLKSVNRLKKETDFSAVFRTGQRRQSQDLLLYWLPNNLENSRVGVVVSKKVGQTAVRRNRLRRIILSECAHLFAQRKIVNGFDIVIRVTKAPAELSDSALLREQLQKCFAVPLSA